MTELQRLNDMLDKVGRLDGINGLRLSDEGTATLRYGGEREVFFEYRRNTATLFIYTSLLYLPADQTRRAQFMYAMLNANFLKLNTWRGELAIDAKSEEAIYQIAMDVATLTVESLDTHIGDLLRQSAECRIALQSGKLASGSTPPSVESTNSRFQRSSFFNRNSVI